MSSPILRLRKLRLTETECCFLQCQLANKAELGSESKGCLTQILKHPHTYFLDD